MRKKFTSQQRIGEIAIEFPKATDIFMDYNIDFCCGGNRLLATALEEQNLAEEEVISKLNKAYNKFNNSNQKTINWQTTSLTELIDHIINKHHQYMKEELPRLNKLLRKILNTHYIKHGGLLSRINQLFYQLRGEIEEHLIKEEKVLFPLIKEYQLDPSQNKLEEIIITMEETETEHDNAGDILKEIRSITNQYQVPSSACRTFELTYEKFEAIESDLFQHIHLENNVLFERLKNN